MSQILRDLYIKVGFGLFPTSFIGETLEVQTENNCSRLVVIFATEYVDYVKTLDILYTGSDLEPHVVTYGLGTALIDAVEQPIFLIPREITYGASALLQFRATYLLGDEHSPPQTVDPTILTLRFRQAIKTTDLYSFWEI
jgi:hypothetical protein